MVMIGYGLDRGGPKDSETTPNLGAPMTRKTQRYFSKMFRRTKKTDSQPTLLQKLTENEYFLNLHMFGQVSHASLWALMPFLLPNSESENC